LFELVENPSTVLGASNDCFSTSLEDYDKPTLSGRIIQKIKRPRKY